MVLFEHFGFWFGIFFHIGKEDRLTTIGFPQEKTQIPKKLILEVRSGQLFD